MSEVSKYELYQEFAQNRERSALRRIIPFAVTATVEFPPGLLIAANPYAAAQVIAEHPELSVALSIATAALTGTGIAALVQHLDITRVNSPNGRIARQIGQLEGRDPQTPADINREVESAKRTVTIASRISPTPAHLFDVAFNHHLARLRSRSHPEALEERAIEDRKMRKWSLRYMGSGETIYPIDPQTATDALLLAERRWASLIENKRKPEYKRRYGELMREDIQRKLAEHLTTPAYGEFERRRVKYESVSAAELGQELKRLIKDFPERSLYLDNTHRTLYPIDTWQRRDESAEKKRLFEQIRYLISHSPTTRGFQEVLIRELGYLYNRGLERGETELPNMDLPLLNAIGLGGNGFEDDIFDSEHCQEVEQKLYKYVQEIYGAKGFFKLLLPTPLLEQSWKRQYRAKYKKNLKS